MDDDAFQLFGGGFDIGGSGNGKRFGHPPTVAPCTAIVIPAERRESEDSSVAHHHL
jgi:hypothetical protein